MKLNSDVNVMVLTALLVFCVWLGICLVFVAPFVLGGLLSGGDVVPPLLMGWAVCLLIAIGLASHAWVSPRGWYPEKWVKAQLDKAEVAEGG